MQPQADRQTGGQPDAAMQQQHAGPSSRLPHAPSASAIHWAATKGDLRTLRRLVEFEGVDPSAKDGSSHHCETPLFRAAGANHTEVRAGVRAGGRRCVSVCCSCCWIGGRPPHPLTD